MSRDFLLGVVVGAASGLAPEVARAAADYQTNPRAMSYLWLGLGIFGAVVIIAGSALKGDV
jgi:hypothetical protein